MQKEAREKSRDHIAKGRGGKNESEIGPGERGEIRIKKAGKADDAEDDPGISEGGKDVRPVAEMDFTQVVHAALEQHVTRAVAAGNGEIDEDFFQFQADIRLCWPYAHRRAWRGTLIE